MKKLIILGGLALSLFTDLQASAQVRVNINIGGPVAQQPWYGDDADYYYMPDQGVYYNVSRGMYVYPEGGRWMYAQSLPARYGGFRYNSGRYYRIHGRAPFERDSYYRRQYAQRNVYRDDRGRHNGWSRGDNRDYNNNGYNRGDGYNNGYNGRGDRDYHGHR